MDLRKTYNSIGKEFSATRYKRWPCVDRFFSNYVFPNDYILDAGCGNGKNMSFQNVFEGSDITDSFLEIAAKKNASLTQSSVQNLPYRSNVFDIVISVAVVHHLDTLYLRKKAVHELVRCVKENGYVLITNWAFENNKFDTQDSFIPFKNCKGEILAKRYYHLFTEDEMPELVKNTSCNIVDYYNEHNNWIIVLQKTK
jgi:ubiquinone/menaquinone biosynthesis C-methylase UbiE